jgi:dTDP-4-dehydrorhamnose 3,5-epimerase-like enzyme
VVVHRAHGWLASGARLSHDVGGIVTVQTTSIDGALIIDHPVHADARGFSHQTSVLSVLSDALGQAPSFVQSNHAGSMPGERPDSPTFATHLSVLLGDGTGRPRIYVPEGVGNAYCVVGDQPADYLYDLAGLWPPGVDPRTVRWDDPMLETRFADPSMFAGT